MLFSCSGSKPAFMGTEVTILYKAKYGEVAVKSIGYGRGKNAAFDDAQKKAFFVLLYRGIPNSEYIYPLIENEVEFAKNNPNFMKDFFDSKLYKSFIISNTESSSLTSTTKGQRLYLDIVINYLALRRYLEQNSLIRKFGY